MKSKPEVQNRGISGPTKRTCVLKLKKQQPKTIDMCVYYTNLVRKLSCLLKRKHTFNHKHLTWTILDMAQSISYYSTILEI